MKLLHVGCGPLLAGQRIPTEFLAYDEIRMDVDAAVMPDVIGSIVDIQLPDASVDGVYAAHVLEHVEPWQVDTALAECYRVLRDGGKAVIVVPDLQAWCRLVVEHPERLELLNEDTGANHVPPLWALYGDAQALENGREGMRHRTGFTRETFASHLQRAGFNGGVIAQYFQLCAVAQKGTPIHVAQAG